MIATLLLTAAACLGVWLSSSLAIPITVQPLVFLLGIYAVYRFSLTICGKLICSEDSVSIDLELVNLVKNRPVDVITESEDLA